ncbi:hypothetical protein NC99_13840 [Sunxiuqinia dokdonensis]|uniref:Uncharacterized protein n=1 Tax=Sunxiuqinia dokdonensis TaxID=1409788 RepID=A0A0L8VBV1_9BACT|nr:hypothetical protein NC99_13840 [Sunxiuqinia dokdonensis]
MLLKIIFIRVCVWSNMFVSCSFIFFESIQRYKLQDKCIILVERMKQFSLNRENSWSKTPKRVGKMISGFL